MDRGVGTSELSVVVEWHDAIGGWRCDDGDPDRLEAGLTAAVVL